MDEDEVEPKPSGLPPRKRYMFLALISYFFKGLAQDFELYLAMWGEYWLSFGRYDVERRELKQMQDSVQFLGADSELQRNIDRPQIQSKGPECICPVDHNEQD